MRYVSVDLEMSGPDPMRHQVLELAAVASTVQTPVLGPALGQLQATTLRRHRPLVRDQATSEDVEVRWPRLSGSLRPHQYALGF